MSAVVPALSPDDAAALDRLRALLKDLGSVAVAFSGGVDSTLLLAVAHEELGSRVEAITAESLVCVPEELESAREFCKARYIRHHVLPGPELSLDEFRENRPERCYFCKFSRYLAMRRVADERGLKWLVEGVNADDLSDYRPGLKAGEEQGVRRPLLESGFDKAMVRRVSAALRLPDPERPAQACLASRFPHGVAITDERLRMVGAAERALRDLGFRHFRVRYHGEVARIELGPDDMNRMMDSGLRERVDESIKAVGFRYVSVDLAGYRTGSMNPI